MQWKSFYCVCCSPFPPYFSHCEDERFVTLEGNPFVVDINDDLYFMRKIKRIIRVYSMSMYLCSVRMFIFALCIQIVALDIYRSYIYHLEINNPYAYNLPSANRRAVVIYSFVDNISQFIQRAHPYMWYTYVRSKLKPRYLVCWCTINTYKLQIRNSSVAKRVVFFFSRYYTCYNFLKKHV